MLRNVVKASSTVLRRFSTSTVLTLLHAPKSIGIPILHRNVFLAPQLRDAPVFLPVALGQARGYARGGRAPAPSEDNDDDDDEEDLSDGDVDPRGMDYQEGDFDEPGSEITDDDKLDDEYDFD
ncbi:hypothetical protein HPP92_002539 [Vanilla planifolia]|uniref:Uncharacterized protein n=1 Tax=Vanilla planifolia TaxID=51239 RepID=A0A835SDY8_VANPL|nr:hypothetical protein HPP92_002539 [Vanilla planifolia]